MKGRQGPLGLREADKRLGPVLHYKNLISQPSVNIFGSLHYRFLGEILKELQTKFTI